MFSKKPLTEQERKILNTVESHAKLKPLSRFELVNKVNRLLLSSLSERRTRNAIREMRKKGVLILSSGGNNGGYYMAGSLDEYYQFRDREYKSRALDILETVSAMDASAAEQFGEVNQMELNFSSQNRPNL
jgi:hypothetical protein